MSRSGSSRAAQRGAQSAKRRVSAEGVYNRGASHIPIEHVPILGTTWYTRGASYWARRALMATVMFIAWVGSVFITAAVVVTMVRSAASTAAKTIGLLIVAATLAYSATWATRWFRRASEQRKRGEPASSARGSLRRDNK